MSDDTEERAAPADPARERTERVRYACRCGVAALCLGIAAYLAAIGADGWGWFLVVLVLVF